MLNHIRNKVKKLKLKKLKYKKNKRRQKMKFIKLLKFYSDNNHKYKQIMYKLTYTNGYSMRIFSNIKLVFKNIKMYTKHLSNYYNVQHIPESIRSDIENVLLKKFH